MRTVMDERQLLARATAGGVDALGGTTCCQKLMVTPNNWLLSQSSAHRDDWVGLAPGAVDGGCVGEARHEGQGVAWRTGGALPANDDAVAIGHHHLHGAMRRAAGGWLVGQGWARELLPGGTVPWLLRLHLLHIVRPADPQAPQPMQSARLRQAGAVCEVHTWQRVEHTAAEVEAESDGVGRRLQAGVVCGAGAGGAGRAVEEARAAGSPGLGQSPGARAGGSWLGRQRHGSGSGGTVAAGLAAHSAPLLPGRTGPGGQGGYRRGPWLHGGASGVPGPGGGLA